LPRRATRLAEPRKAIEAAALASKLGFGTEGGGLAELAEAQVDEAPAVRFQDPLLKRLLSFQLKEPCRNPELKSISDCRRRRRPTRSHCRRHAAPWQGWRARSQRHLVGGVRVTRRSAPGSSQARRRRRYVHAPPLWLSLQHRDHAGRG
jgi:hypothetical protein